jgi:hypothetical protein
MPFWKILVLSIGLKIAILAPILLCLFLPLAVPAWVLDNFLFVGWVWFFVVGGLFLLYRRAQNI